MAILRMKRYILIKDFENLVVGKAYEVANIMDETVVLRDASSKLAVAIIKIEDFEEYFVESEKAHAWTPWTAFRNEQGGTSFYRTNGKKVEVKHEGTKSAAYRSKADDFNLYFGVNLACLRCEVKKALKDMKKLEEHRNMIDSAIRELEGEIKDRKNLIKTMINSLEEKVEE